MKHLGRPLTVLLLVMMMTSGVIPLASAYPASGNLAATILPESRAGIRVISSSNNGLVYELDVPWEEVSLETVTREGISYTQVSLPGWESTSQAGAPLLPDRVDQIAAPFGSTVTVEALPGKAHTLQLSAPVLPVATEGIDLPLPSANSGDLPQPTVQQVFTVDDQVYGSASDYPGGLAEISQEGVLRQTRVIAIRANPVQYNPQSMQLTVYETLQVEVRFEGGMLSPNLAGAQESKIYTDLLSQEILNYSNTSQWQQDPGSVPGIQPMSGAAGTPLPWPPPNPGWRIKVRTDGIYKLTYSQLAAAGIPVDSLVPKTLQLFNLGSECAIYVAGEGDGVFGTDDYILFYGQSLASKYTSDNVYWLTHGLVTQGMRMGTRDGAPDTAASPAFYTAVQHMESNAYYLSYTPGSGDLERWMWNYIYPSSRPNWTYSFTLTAPTTGAGSLTVSLLGYLEDAINPDHHVQVNLNGTQLAEAWFDGIVRQDLTMSVPSGLLVAGSNTIQVVCPNDTGLGYDVVYVDWAELTFPNTFTAVGNVLQFGYSEVGEWKFQVDGFVNSDVTLFDVSDVALPVQITGGSLTGAGPYSIVFQDSLASAANYIATNGSAYKTVQGIDPLDTPSNLASDTNGADHIVISHATFLSQAQTLSTYRGEQMRAISVDVQDIYDEFNYGIVGAAPIHDFLAYAYTHWVSPAPAFVVLLGDGNYDPKNYLGYGRTSFIPPYLLPVDPWIRETAADNRYVTLVGDDTLPDMMLGRLPVNDTTEASVLINKIIDYQKSPVLGDWQRKILMIADNADSAGDFAQLSDSLISCCLTKPYQTEKVYLGVTHADKTTAKAALLAGINSGALIVNYAGHGFTTGWADESLFVAADVASLTNGGMLPVILAMTCRDGYYIYPNPYSAKQEALAEVVTRASGKGGVASWSATGLGVASGHDTMERGFMSSLLNNTNGVNLLGKATQAGLLNLWSQGNDLDLLDTYLLFGDPATWMVIFDSLYLPLTVKTP